MKLVSSGVLYQNGYTFFPDRMYEGSLFLAGRNDVRIVIEVCKQMHIRFNYLSLGDAMYSWNIVQRRVLMEKIGYTLCGIK